MDTDTLEKLLVGGEETASLEFKAAIAWDARTFVKDILAMGNVIDGGTIIVGVEDQTFVRQGLNDDQIESFNIEIMRDQIAPYADPLVVFRREVVSDRAGLRYVVIEVSTFEEIPVSVLAMAPMSLRAQSMLGVELDVPRVLALRAAQRCGKSLKHQLQEGSAICVGLDCFPSKKTNMTTTQNYEGYDERRPPPENQVVRILACKFSSARRVGSAAEPWAVPGACGTGISIAQGLGFSSCQSPQ